MWHILKKDHIFCNKISTSFQEIHHFNEMKDLLHTKSLKTVETVAIYNTRKDHLEGMQNKKTKLAKTKYNC